MSAHSASSKARVIWSLVPREYKRALITLEEQGRKEMARDWCIAEAARQIQKLSVVYDIDYAFALEQAAEQWLAANPIQEERV